MKASNSYCFLFYLNIASTENLFRRNVGPPRRDRWLPCWKGKVNPDFVTFSRVSQKINWKLQFQKFWVKFWKNYNSSRKFCQQTNGYNSVIFREKPNSVRFIFAKFSHSVLNGHVSDILPCPLHCLIDIFSQIV